MDFDSQFTAHSFLFPDGKISTSEVNENHVRYLNRVISATLAHFGGSVEGKTVIDLGALEGAFGIEMLARGADVTFVDAREKNCDLIKYALDKFGFKKASIVCKDVTRLDPSDVMPANITFCLGLLYHLRLENIKPFVEWLSSNTTDISLIDTHFALEGNISFEGLSGKYFTEHSAAASEQEIAQNRWASIYREPSFFLTKDSLFNLLAHNGFPVILDVQVPYYRIMADRITVLAVKGTENQMITCPAVEDIDYPKLPFDEIVEAVNKE